jgi:hypothetical protein
MRAAPAAASGQGAVAMADESRTLREAKSVAELDAAAVGAVRQDLGSNELKRVGSRVFKREGQAWKDVALKPGVRTMEIEPWSEAYFRVLEALPELKANGAALPGVTIAGARVAVKFADGGARTIPAAELSRLVAEFRR